MKYLIISNYDSCTDFSICTNGKICDNYGTRKCSNKIIKICEDMENKCRCVLDFRRCILKTYGQDYDLIVYCENGQIEVFKNEIH